MEEITNFIELLVKNNIDFDAREMYGGIQIFVDNDRFSIIYHRLSYGYLCGKIDLYDSIMDIEYTCLNGKEAYEKLMEIKEKEGTKSSWWRYLD